MLSPTIIERILVPPLQDYGLTWLTFLGEYQFQLAYKVFLPVFSVPHKGRYLEFITDTITSFLFPSAFQLVWNTQRGKVLSFELLENKYNLFIFFLKQSKRLLSMKGMENSLLSTKNSFILREKSDSKTPQWSCFSLIRFFSFIVILYTIGIESVNPLVQENGRNFFNLFKNSEKFQGILYLARFPKSI